MDPDKRIGYALLLLGLGIIFFAVFSSFSVFNGKAPPHLFNIQKKSEPVTVKDQQVQNLEVVPAEYLNQSGDLTFFMLFMFFLVSAGGRISSIGVNMLHAKKTEPLKQG